MSLLAKAKAEKDLGERLGDQRIDWFKAKDEADAKGLSWEMVEHWADREYEKQQRASK